MIGRIIIFIMLFMLGATSAGSETGGGTPLWWHQAFKEAGENGFALMTPKELKEDMRSGKDFLLLDVRPDYEYASGHIPEALNFEFDLGDRLRLSQAKEKEIKTILGNDKERKIIIYCRSFR